MQHPVGTRVIASESHIHHKNWIKESQNRQGTVIDAWAGYNWNFVLWDGETRRYSYPAEYLIPIDKIQEVGDNMSEPLFKVGQRVRVDKESCPSSIQYKNSDYEQLGKINEEPFMGSGAEKQYFYNIKWDNGDRSRNYPESMIVLIDEEGEDQVTKINQYTKGTRVRPNPEHEDYYDYYDQHKEDFGTITSGINTGRYVTVRWDNGHVNGYEKDMLIIVDENGNDVEPTLSAKKQIIPQNNTPPLLEGMRVCLNPEMEGYNLFNEKSGYIISMELNEPSLKKWKTISQNTLDSLITKVMFDNNKIINVKIKHLLPIEAPPAEVVKYEVYSGSGRHVENVYVVNDNPKQRDKLDHYVIVDRCLIYKTTIYNDEYRQKLIDKINA